MIITFQREIPVGNINGTNTDFTVNNRPVLLYLNGQFQTEDVEYTISGGAPFTITYIQAPLSGSHISLY